MATGKGGYDYEFVTPPPKTLECPVCLLTLRDPHVISCCGNEFCQVCIQRVQRDGKPCPLCNEPSFTMLLHKKLVREVNALVVRCPQKELGCGWEGELGQLQLHLNPEAGPSSKTNGCAYVMVACSYQCGVHLQRQMVQEHEMEVCPRRPVEMQVASLMRKFEAITVENQCLRQELNVMKEAHEQELKEMKPSHKQDLNEVAIENQLLRQELNTIKDAYEQELKEMKHAYQQQIDGIKQVCQQQIDGVRQACQQEIDTVKQANQQQQQELNKLKLTHQHQMDEIQQTRQEIKKRNDLLERTHECMQKNQVALEEKCVSLQTHTSPLLLPPFYFTVLNIDPVSYTHLTLPTILRV